MSPTSDPITVATVDTDPPTAPGKPTGSSPSSGTIAINWAASTDVSPPITYRVYRDGNLTAVGSTTSTSFTDDAPASPQARITPTRSMRSMASTTARVR